MVGVYRLHEGGVYSSLETEHKIKTSIGIFKNIKKINDDSRADIQIIKDLDLLISKYYYLKEFSLPLINSKLYSAVIERFALSRDIKTFSLQLLKIIKYSINR